MLLRAFVLTLALLGAVGAAAQPATYVVRAGDTLYRIASANNTTVAELRRLNELPDDNIRVGQVLRLTALGPVEPRPPAGSDGAADAPPPAERPVPRGPQAVLHTVQAGETLAAIARRYDTTPDVLRRLNGLVGDRVHEGQTLVVLRAGRTAAPDVPVAASADPPRPAEPTIAGPAASVGDDWRMDRTTVPADVVHFVEPGETLYSVAARFGFGTDALIAANPGLSTAPLEPGRMLALPEPVDPSVPREEALPPPDTVGLALVYPRAMEGRRTASGELYDPEALTASHRTLALGTVVLITNPAAGRSTFVRVTDRGPISGSYLMELSAAAAEALALDPNAARRVELRTLP